jgi:hypothetical protein
VARTSRVVDFSLIRPKLCDTCVNAYMGRSGVYCVEFNEFIFDEEVAEDCGAFEED